MWIFHINNINLNVFYRCDYVTVFGDVNVRRLYYIGYFS